MISSIRCMHGLELRYSRCMYMRFNTRTSLMICTQHAPVPYNKTILGSFIYCPYIHLGRLDGEDVRGEKTSHPGHSLDTESFSSFVCVCPCIGKSTSFFTLGQDIF